MKELVATHIHVLDTFDAVHGAKKMLQAAAEKGYTHVCVVGHGNMMAIDDAYDLIKGEHKMFDLQIIYGCEVYIDLVGIDIDKKNGHMIVYAIDEKGKHEIDKMLAHSYIRNDGRAVVTHEYLSEHKSDLMNHVVATSACIAGAPAMAFQENAIFEKELSKLNSKKAKILESAEISADFDIESANEELAEILNDIGAVQEELAAAKKLAKRSTKAKENKLAKIAEKLGSDSEEYADAAAELEAFKAESAQAAKKVSELEAQKKELWDGPRAELKQSIDQYNKVNTEIEKIEKSIGRVKDSMLSEEECRTKAREELDFFKGIFGKYYLVEVQNHRIPEEISIYPKLVELAKECDIKLIAANDAHIPTPEDAEARDVAAFRRFEKVSSDEEMAYNREMYVKSQDELRSILCEILSEEDVDHAIANADALAKICKYVPKKESHAPKYIPDHEDDMGLSADELLKKYCKKGVKRLFLDKGKKFTKEYLDELNLEYKVITQMGFSDYFLIVMDYCNYAYALGPVPFDRLEEAPLTIDGAKAFCAQNGWRVGMGIGLGRGSGVGSLITYLLGITMIDPLPLGLYFERFLNPERVSMPDIDIDFRPDIRYKTIEYVRSKYGNDGVCSIMTKAYMAPKGAVRDAARYLGVKIFGDSKATLALANKIRKDIPSAPKTSFDTIVGGSTTVYDKLVHKYGDDEIAMQILELARKCEGTFTQTGVHAGGIIISDTSDISELIPLAFNSKAGRWTTNCDMVQAEGMEGLLKMDFLGLKTLGILTECAQMVLENTGKEIDLYSVESEFDLDPVFKNIFAAGNTSRVFQFESPGMKKFLRELSPSSLEDMIAANSLFRPGPIDEIPNYVREARKAKGLS